MPKTPVSKFATLIIAIVFLSILLAIGFSSSPETLNEFPSFEIVSLIEKFITENGKAASTSIFINISTIIIVCILWRFFSNFKLHYHYKRKFKYTPDPSIVSDDEIDVEINHQFKGTG